MRVHRLQDPVYTSNVYLIEAARPVLVDTGGGLVEEIRALIEQVLAGRPLSAIVTHGHPDHVGGAEELSEAFQAPVYIHPADREHAPYARALGETVALGEATLQVLPTPGHSPGSVCLHEPGSGILFSGDCAFPGGRAGRWDLPGAHWADLRRSLEELVALRVSTLYPGHGEPLFRDVGNHLAASLETVIRVGDPFDEAAYDRRIAELSGTLG